MKNMCSRLLLIIRWSQRRILLKKFTQCSAIIKLMMEESNLLWQNVVIIQILNIKYHNGDKDIYVHIVVRLFKRHVKRQRMTVQFVIIVEEILNNLLLLNKYVNMIIQQLAQLSLFVLIPIKMNLFNIYFN